MKRRFTQEEFIVIARAARALHYYYSEWENRFEIKPRYNPYTHPKDNLDNSIKEEETRISEELNKRGISFQVDHRNIKIICKN